MFSGLFIKAVITAHASSIAKYGRVAISNDVTLGSGFTQYTLTNSVGSAEVLNWLEEMFGIIIFIIFPFMYDDIV